MRDDVRRIVSRGEIGVGAGWGYTYEIFLSA